MNEMSESASTEKPVSLTERLRYLSNSEFGVYDAMVSLEDPEAAHDSVALLVSPDAGKAALSNTVEAA
jgi:hypothetical protein